MARVINTNSPGKQRSTLRRTVAEILRHLMLKREIDTEAKDMVAALVFSLRGIDDSVKTTLDAWEKRNYFLKADRFRIEWEWARPAAEALADLIVNEKWERLPGELAKLAPHFSDIRIAKMTRAPSVWHSSYELLLREDGAAH